MSGLGYFYQSQVTPYGSSVYQRLLLMRPASRAAGKPPSVGTRR
jgi:hypothetical protein